MTIYECKRCMFSTKIRKKLEIHLNKKTLCKPILNDIDRSLLAQELEEYKKKNLKGGIICQLNHKEPQLNHKIPQINIENNKYQCHFCSLTFTTNSHMRRLWDGCRQE